MPTRHTRKATELNALDVRVRFSPEMRTRFARLEAMMVESEHFTIEMANTLRDLSAGREMTVMDVMAHLTMIVRDADKHIHATGDSRAREALNDLIYDLSGLEAGPLFTLIKEPTKRQER